MGYRSEVGFACSQKDYLSLAKQMEDKGFNLFDIASDTDTFQLDGEWWTWFRWESLRWYKCYEDVQIIMNFMNNPDNKFQFIRLGEDYEDPPEVINPMDECDWFGVYRSVDVNI